MAAVVVDGRGGVTTAAAFGWSVSKPQLRRLEGMAAKALGRPIEACPYRAKRAGSQWRGGWRSLKPALTAAALADERVRKVSRGTKPGRGRSRFGLRPDWPDWQIERARKLHDAGYGPSSIAADISRPGLERSPGAVSCKLTRSKPEASP